MKRLGLRCSAVLALLSSAGAAELPAVVHVWYRSSEGCPDGDAFVRRLRELGRAAQLAQVGDPVDFLVSVSSAPGGSSGRLERQTQAGQLAIREMLAPECQQITEGLALSLDLTLDPQAAAAVTTPSPRGAEVRLGAAGTLATGLSPAPLPGLALFAELAAQAAGPSARLEARGAHGGGEGRADVDLDVDVLLGRLEGCPLAWSTGAWSLRPCAALDLGGVWASSSYRTGRSDAGLWASASLLGRAVWQFDPRWQLDLQAGVALPFVRYDLGAVDDAPVFRTHAIAFELGVGAAWRLP